MPRASMICLSMLLLPIAAVSHAGEAVSDPFFGDWQGAGLVAQVIARGDGNYQINLLPEFDVKCQPLAVVAGRATDGVLRFEQHGWSGQATGERMTGTRPGEGQPATFELQKVVRLSPTVGAKPPRDAVVLFDGSGFDQWEAQTPANAPDLGHRYRGQDGRRVGGHDKNAVGPFFADVIGDFGQGLGLGNPD